MVPLICLSSFNNLSLWLNDRKCFSHQEAEREHRDPRTKRVREMVEQHQSVTQRGRAHFVQQIVLKRDLQENNFGASQSSFYNMTKLFVESECCLENLIGTLGTEQLVS